MLHFFEGFETVGTELGLANQATTRPRIVKRWDAFNAGPTPSQDSFFLIDDYLNEGFAINMGTSSFSSNNYVAWRVPDAKKTSPGPTSPTWIVGERVHIPSTSRSFTILKVDGELGVDPDANAFQIRVENSANLVVFRGESLVEIARKDSIFNVDTWVYIETKFRIGDSGDGILEIKVEGTTQLNPDPVDLNPSLTTAAVEFQFRASPASTTPGDYAAYDDIYIQEGGDFLGPSTRVLRIPLSADSTPLEWTPSAAADHYSLVDENGADTSDYIEEIDDQETDMFLHDALPDQGDIYAVKLEAEAINLSGTNGLDVQLDSSGSISATKHTIDNTSDYEVFDHYAEQDPNTGSEWTKAGVDGTKVGVQIQQG